MFFFITDLARHHKMQNKFFFFNDKSCKIEVKRILIIDEGKAANWLYKILQHAQDDHF